MKCVVSLSDMNSWRIPNTTQKHSLCHEWQQLQSGIEQLSPSIQPVLQVVAVHLSSCPTYVLTKCGLYLIKQCIFRLGFYQLVILSCDEPGHYLSHNYCCAFALDLLFNYTIIVMQMKLNLLKSLVIHVALRPPAYLYLLVLFLPTGLLSLRLVCLTRHHMVPSFINE